MSLFWRCQGDLNLELHCDIVPRTCENFLVLAEGGYYTDTIFHRSIRSFMVQVGCAGVITLSPSPSCRSAVGRPARQHASVMLVSDVACQAG